MYVVLPKSKVNWLPVMKHAQCKSFCQFEQDLGPLR